MTLDREEALKILDLSNTATNPDIRRQYLKLAKSYHPDTHPKDPEAAAKFMRMAGAYDFLQKNTPSLEGVNVIHENANLTEIPLRDAQKAFQNSLAETRKRAEKLAVQTEREANVLQRVARALQTINLSPKKPKTESTVATSADDISEASIINISSPTTPPRSKNELDVEVSTPKSFIRNSSPPRQSGGATEEIELTPKRTVSSSSSPFSAIKRLFTTGKANSSRSPISERMPVDASPSITETQTQVNTPKRTVRQLWPSPKKLASPPKKIDLKDVAARLDFGSTEDKTDVPESGNASKNTETFPLLDQSLEFSAPLSAATNADGVETKEIDLAPIPAMPSLKNSSATPAPAPTFWKWLTRRW